MNGTIALLGGGEFGSPYDELDRRLLAIGGDQVLIIPTADAFEHPMRLVDRAVNWFAGLGAKAEGLMVLSRPDAQLQEHADRIDAASFVYLVGDSPLHLRGVMKGTPIWDAICAVVERGGVVAASTGAAAALCDPMVDPRGGAFTLGLGLIKGLAVITLAETWTEQRRRRSVELASGFPIAEVPSGSALLRTDGAWEQVGEMVIDGELPA
jgi:cyanophycinase